MAEKTFEEELKEMSEQELKDNLEWWKNEHLRSQYSDDFYYSNGGWSRAERTIRAYEQELKNRKEKQ